MKFIYFAFWVMLLPISVYGQIVTLVGGGGSGSGFGVPATSVTMGGSLAGINVDKYGNVYVAQQLSNTVVMIDTLGYIYPVAGTGGAGFSGNNGPATAAELSEPQNIGFDTFGNIYIADAVNARIRKIDILTGIMSTVCGNGVQADLGNGGMATAASCRYPLDVKFDRQNNMYIASANAGSIRMVNNAGIISKIAGADSAGNTGDGGPATLARIVAAFLFITDDNQIYFSGPAGSESIRMIDRSGIVTHIAGKYKLGFYNGDNIPATNAGLDPLQFVVAPDGSIYVSDYANNRIRNIDRSGIIHTFLGDGTLSSSGDGGTVDTAKTNGPGGMTFDKCNNILFAQINEQRLRKITFDHCNYLSVSQLAAKNQQVKITPNPVIDLLNINSEVEIESIEIFDFTGRCIFSTCPKQFNYSVPTDGWSTGLYFLRVNHGQIQKVLKN